MTDRERELEDDIKTLHAALLPFAVFSGAVMSPVFQSESLLIKMGEYSLTVGNLRNARTAILSRCEAGITGMYD